MPTSHVHSHNEPKRIEIDFISECYLKYLALQEPMSHGTLHGTFHKITVLILQYL